MPISPGAAMPMAPARKARPSAACSKRASPASRRCCTTRTIASTTSSTATTTTSSRAGSRSRCGICRGAQPVVYHNDHSRPERPRIRTLREEIGRIVRGRVVNPKWIAGVMRHGYKGAFEIAATVDYLFAFAATARAVDDQHFDALFEAYLGDDRGARASWPAHNPAALAEMSEPLSSRRSTAACGGRAATGAAHRAELWRSAERARPMNEHETRPRPRSTARHREKMARRKAARDRMLATKTEEKRPPHRPHRHRARANRPPPSAWCCAASATACGSASSSSSRARGRPASAPCWRASPISSPAGRWARASPGRRRTAPATSPPRAPPGTRRRR